MLYNKKGRMDDVAFALVRDWRARGMSTTIIANRLNVARSTVTRSEESAVLPSNRPKRVTALCTRRNIAVRRKLAKKLAAMSIKKVGWRGKSGRAKPMVIFRRIFPSCVSISRELRARYNISCSPTTVRRDLAASGMEARVKPHGPRRKELDVEDRVAFATLHKDDDATRYLFSDEKISDCNDHGGRYEWNEKGTKPSHLERERFGAKIMVFGLIGVGVKKLVFLDGAGGDGESARMDHVTYQRKCLQPLMHVLQRPNAIFMQDGARCHTDAAVLKYLRSKRVEISSWPARSPDLNPIEVMWSRIQYLVDREAPSSVEDLRKFWQNAWDTISQDEVDRLVVSFSDRLKACIINRGNTLPNNWRELLNGRRAN